jgi:hypothetical protein
MGGLEIAAGIIAVLQLTQEVIQYLLEVKDANADRQSILNEVTSAHSFLYLLKDRAERSAGANSDATSFDTLRALSTPRGPLEQFKTALERLAKKLRPQKALKKAYKALAWPFEKAEVDELLEAIERQKSLFGLALQNDHMYSFLILEGFVSFNSTLSEKIKDDIQKVTEQLSELQIGQKCT